MDLNHLEYQSNFSQYFKDMSFECPLNEPTTHGGRQRHTADDRHPTIPKALFELEVNYNACIWLFLKTLRFLNNLPRHVAIYQVTSDE